MTKKHADIIVLVIIRDAIAPLSFVGNSSTYGANAKGGGAAGATTGRRPAKGEGKSGSARWIPCHCLGGW